MRTAIWITLAILVAGYVVFAFATVDHNSDEAQITAIVQKGTEATQNRNPGSLISVVSTNYKDEAGLNYDRLRLVLAQALRNETDFTVSTSIKNTRIKGDTATVQLHVTIKRPLKGEVFYDRDLTMLLAKESGRHAMIIPVKVWRVTGSRNLGLGMDESGI